MTAAGSGLAERAEEMRADFDRGFAAARRVDIAAKHDLIAIRVGTEPFAIRLTEVSGLFADRKITRVPGSHNALLGIAGFRGALVPVYGLRALLRQSGTQSAALARHRGGGAGRVRLRYIRGPFARGGGRDSESSNRRRNHPAMRSSSSAPMTWCGPFCTCVPLSMHSVRQTQLNPALRRSERSCFVSVIGPSAGALSPASVCRRWC